MSLVRQVSVLVFLRASLVVHTTNSPNGYRSRSSPVNHVTYARDHSSDVAFVLANQVALKSSVRSSSPSSELLLIRDGPEEHQHSTLSHHKCVSASQKCGRGRDPRDASARLHCGLWSWLH
uniref:Secreted protein n=1 Tax=Peronospora matthiolae TaxID=2874970 RepID=A0AAV1UBN9_9STRA